VEIDKTEKLPTFYANKDNEVAIHCPKCKFIKTFDASRLNVTGKSLKVRCKCGEVFKCIVELRKIYRKAVKLAGKYVNLKTGMTDDILVQDLSYEGIGFSVFVGQMFHNLQKGDELEVSFKLDDAKKSEIRKRVKVRVVKDSFIGAEFSDIQWFDKDLGFYLLP